jgi:hypothetical protein
MKYVKIRFGTLNQGGVCEADAFKIKKWVTKRQRFFQIMCKINSALCYPCRNFEYKLSHMPA